MHRIKITPLIRFLLVLCIIVAGTAVNPQVVKADAKPGWIVSCTFSHSLNDDPIVFPGQVGVSHLHDFTGATTTNAFSTFTSLRTGGTTCAIPGDKSAYWVPALYEDGVRILPQAPSGNSVFYYRRIGAPEGTVVQPFPPGLRISLETRVQCPLRKILDSVLILSSTVDPESRVLLLFLLHRHTAIRA